MITPDIQIPEVAGRLERLSESWTLAASGLRDRVAKLEAAEITEAELSAGDLIVDLQDTAQARVFAAVRAGVIARVEALLATNDPEVVQANLRGEGDGTTPTIGVLVADQLEGLQPRDRPISGPDSPDGVFVIPVFSIPTDGTDGNPTGLVDFVDQLADIVPGGEFLADVLFAREIAEFFSEGNDGQGFLGNVRDLVAGALAAIGGLFSDLFGDDPTDGGGGGDDIFDGDFNDDDGDGVPNTFDPDPEDPDVGLDEGEFGGTPTDPNAGGDGGAAGGDGGGTGGGEGTGGGGTGGDGGGGGSGGDGGNGNDNGNDGDSDGDGTPDGFDPDPNDPDVNDGGEGEFGGTPTDPEAGNGGDDGSDSGGDDGGEDRVICTYFYHKGDLSRSDWVADLRFTSDNISERTVRGYHVWAIPTVRLMCSGSPIGRLIEPPMRFIARHRARELAHLMGRAERGDLAGKIIRVTMEPLCSLIGLLARTSSGPTASLDVDGHNEAVSHRRLPDRVHRDGDRGRR